MGLLKSAAVLVGQLGLGLLAYGVLSGHPGSGQPSASTSTPVAIVAPTAATVAANRGSQRWSVQVDDATLTQNLNTWAAQQPSLQTPVGTAQLQRLTVHMADDQVLLNGVADTGWIAEPFSAEMFASVSGGRATVHVSNAQLGDLTVPDSARSALEQELQHQLDQFVAANRVTVESVSIRPGTLVINGTRL